TQAATAVQAEALPDTSPRTQILVKTETQPQAATEETMPETKAKASDIGNTTANSKQLPVHRKSGSSEAVRRRYIGQDEDTNKRRLETLLQTLNRLKSQDSDKPVDGARLAGESSIGTAKSLRSR